MPTSNVIFPGTVVDPDVVEGNSSVGSLARGARQRFGSIGSPRFNNVHSFPPCNVGDGRGDNPVPGGTTLIFRAGAARPTCVDPDPTALAHMSSGAQLASAGIPCFTAGTPILTPRGPIPVENLRIGDVVITRDNGLQPIVWAGQRRLGRQALRAMPNLRPIQLASGTFGNKDPVLFSPQHGLLLHDRAAPSGETFVRAGDLTQIKGGQVRVARAVSEVSYVHLMFEAHQVIMSGGIWSESFYPGPQALASLRTAEVAELTTLFPDLARGRPEASYGQQARDFAAPETLAPQLSALSAVAG